MGISYGICLPESDMTFGGCLLDVPIQNTVPGLVNVDIANWKDPPCFMGKSTISMVIFNSKLLVYQRVPYGKRLQLANWKITMLNIGKSTN